MMRTLLLSAIVCAATAVHAQELKCEIKEKYVCGAGGCGSIPATVWNIINLDKQTYARCDAKGCETHSAQTSEAGAFLHIQVGPSTIAKMATIDVPMMELKKYSFHEIATQFHAVYVSFGSCRAT